MRIEQSGKILSMYDDGFELTIRPWGSNSLRVQMWPVSQPDDRDWALTEEVEETEPEIEIKEVFLQAPWEEEEDRVRSQTGVIRNGNISAEIGPEGWITFRKADGSVILQEYWRNRDRIDRYAVPQGIAGRQMSPVPGSYEYRLTARFEADPDEHIYGMGQYQELNLDKKGEVLDLEQRNSQITIPFYVSSLGYGFFWNNPAIGRVSFAKNCTTWEAYSTKKLDYWICAGDTPAMIEESYAGVTGTVPMMPEYGLGFWQCKLRYQTQEELLEVAREYKRRNIPLDVIVADFFHWPKQGDWRFDETYWPDPDSMIAELKEMGIELMVSVWPMVDYLSENFEEMKARGLLTRVEKGVRIDSLYMGNTVHFDATNPEAREYVWEKVRKNYFNKGVRIFWLDEAEPEYTVYDFENYRYFLGTNQEIGNIYPVKYAKGFFEGMKREGMDKIVNLLRCAWAGSQKYGALVWSGDIQSSFASMRRQITAGLNMAIAGIPWWTTDIGGFFGGDSTDPDFHELLVRWFEYGTFCPVMRLHGYRMPYQPQYGTTGGAACVSGAPNEIWSYGEEVEKILERYIRIRENLRPYIRSLMEQAHEKGTPVMRPLFYDFPEDGVCWEIEDEYMFGPDLLVAPVTEIRQQSRRVYLPGGKNWASVWTGESFEGGTWAHVPAPLDQIPLFTINGKIVF